MIYWLAVVAALYPPEGDVGFVDPSRIDEILYVGNGKCTGYEFNLLVIFVAQSMAKRQRRA